MKDGNGSRVANAQIQQYFWQNVFSCLALVNRGSDILQVKAERPFDLGLATLPTEGEIRGLITRCTISAHLFD